MTNTSDIYKLVDSELIYAAQKWGFDFDNKNTLNDWLVYANVYMAKAGSMKATKEDQFNGLIKAIGLLTNAALRVKDDMLAKRHYDV